MKLSLDTAVTTVGSYEDSPLQPSLDYGDEVKVVFNNESEDGDVNCTTVKVGDYLLLPSQLAYILDEVNKYHAAMAAYVSAGETV
jgi:hypothetical protein